MPTAPPAPSPPGLRPPRASGRRSALRLPAVLAVAVLVLTACGGPSDHGGAAAGTPVPGGTLTYATGDNEPACLDPVVSGNVPQALVSTQYRTFSRARATGRTA